MGSVLGLGPRAIDRFMEGLSEKGHREILAKLST
jgi:hypothetical protein